MEVVQMPGNDGTGPLGRGSMTGRGLGPCGSGQGRGFRKFGQRAFGFQPVELTKEEQKKILKAELEALEAEKKDLSKKLKELK